MKHSPYCNSFVFLLFPTAIATISFTSVGYLDDNTCHAECTVYFW